MSMCIHDMLLDLAQNLILNEDVLINLSEKKRPVFIYEWLCYLNKILIVAQKNEIRDCQSDIIEQLFKQIENEPGPAIRILIGRNLSILLSIEDSISLVNTTINRCHDILKTNNESAQLTTVAIIGILYEHLGRLIDRLQEETIQLLLKLLKNGHSQMRVEVLNTFERILNGLGSNGRNIHREIFKTAKTHLCDRTMSVRVAAAKCLICIIHQNNFMYTSELEGNILLGFRGFKNSNYEVRCSIAKYLAILLTATQDIGSDKSQSLMNKSNSSSLTNTKKMKVEDMLSYLSEGFLRGNLNLLKSSLNEQIKGSTPVSNEIRVGITHTYVELFHRLGSTWLEEHLTLLLHHIFELATNLSTSLSHIDSISSRKCITFLRSIINAHLNEQSQILLAKELMTLITRHSTPQLMVNSSIILINDSNISSLNSSTNSMIQSYGSQLESPDIETHHHILICVLNQFSLLIQNLNISTFLLLQENSNRLIDILFLIIHHPSHSVRLSGAWCFRTIGITFPSLLTPLIDKCLEKINELIKQTTTNNIDSIGAFALVLQGLLGAVHQCPLGIPFDRVKTIFNFSKTLLCTSITSTSHQQQSLILHYILQRTHTAWNLLSACCTLDQYFLRKFLPRLILLWRNVFPRSQTDFEQEKQRADLFTWILSFNQRSNALCSIRSFLQNFHTDDLIKHLLNPIEISIVILAHTSNLIKQFGQQLKISTMIYRLRLYELLLAIPVDVYEQHFQILLTELMADFTLTDTSLNIRTSLFKSICLEDGRVLFSNYHRESDYQLIEEQLQSNSMTNFRALEHDETYLYRPDPSLSLTNNNSSFLPTKLNIPEPLPLNIAVIDTSIRLYSNIFIRISNKHRLSMFQHFIDLIKQAKDTYQETIQINILTAVLLSLKTLAKTKQSLLIDDDNLKKSACTLIIQTLDHSNPILRYISSQALGHLIQVTNDPRFLSDIFQFCYDHLKESRDIHSRTGYSLALAYLYRYMNNTNKGQYLNLTISILLTLIQDQSVPIVQIWALHALTLIVDSSGQNFSNYIEPLLTLILHLLLSIPTLHADIYQCCGRLLSTLIINLGPDLQINTNNISTLRSYCLSATSLLQMHDESIVQAEAIHALQQLHVFAPRYVNLSILIPELIKGLKSQDLLLRRACMACLRQLSQREAKQISEHTKLLFINDTTQFSMFNNLEELLFSMLDNETDLKICINVQDTIISMLQILGPYNLKSWLQLCQDILSTTIGKSNTLTSSETDYHPSTTSSPNSPNEEDEDDDDDCTITDNTPHSQITVDYDVTHNSIFSSTKWQTKLFALDCIQKLLIYCEQTSQSNLHFNSQSAKEQIRTYPNEDYLILHLNILITISYMACKSTNDQLQLSGLSLLKQIILKFLQNEENIPSSTHLIQQIGATVRPAFSQTTSSFVTIEACDVCNTLISSNIAQDLNDLRRLHQLLLASLQRFTSIQKQKNDKKLISSEITFTNECLNVLKLWADVYNFSILEKNSNLLILIQTELYILIHHWLALLTDYALLTLPNNFGGLNDKSHNGNFYFIESNMDLTKPIYKSTWSVILQATIQWLVEHNFNLEIVPTNYGQRNVLLTKLLTLTVSNKILKYPEKKEEIFSMLFGCCIEAISFSISEQTDETIERILLSLINLLQIDTAKSQITMNISIELINVLHRLYLVRTDLRTRLKILKILEIIFDLRRSFVDNDDQLIPGKSFLYASLQLLTAILLNYYPDMSNDLELTVKSNENAIEDFEIVEITIKLLYELIQFCKTEQNTQEVIPIILHLFLSTSFALLTQKSDKQETLLSTITERIENIIKISINENIAHRTLITIIKLRTNLIEKHMSDTGYFIQCLTSLVLNSNSIKITNEIIDFYRKAFDEKQPETHLRIYKCLNQLFQSTNLTLRNKFIQIFAPLLLIDLKQTHNSQQIIEILNIFQTLLSVVDSTLRIRLATSIIPLFINLLSNSISTNNEELRSDLIERIQHLLRIYPNEFRIVLQKLPNLRTKLENSIRRQQQQQSENGNESNHLSPTCLTPIRIDLANFKFDN